MKANYKLSEAAKKAIGDKNRGHKQNISLEAKAIKNAHLKELYTEERRQERSALMKELWANRKSV